jgi:electron transport complex protein RnfG
MSEQKLPVMEPSEPGAPNPPVQVSTSSVRLVGTLAFAGAMAGLAIVLVFAWANPQIEAHRALVLAQAITEVLGGPERYETVYLEDGRLTPQPADTTGLDRVYVGYDASDQPIGVAMQAGEAGFQDIISLIFGYDPGTGDLMGMKVLESKETPGLGDKIEKDSAFVRQFREVGTPLEGVKADRASGDHVEVVMITGATISSRAIINIINHRLEALGGPVSTYWSSPMASAPGITSDPGGGS